MRVSVPQSKPSDAPLMSVRMIAPFAFVMLKLPNALGRDAALTSTVS